MAPGSFRWIRNLPSRLAARLIAVEFVSRWREERYRARLATHQHRSNSSMAKTLASELERQGVVKLHATALNPADVERALSVGYQLLERSRAALLERSKTEDFITVPPQELYKFPSLFQFGLHNTILDIVETYLGQPAAYDGVAIHFTRADGREAATRLWHRDREDSRMVKLFLSLNEVGEADGPFELLPIVDGATQVRARTHAFVLAQDEQIALAASDLTRPSILCTGTAGSVFLADTARFFHRGRPATGRDRGAVFFSYFAARPQRPFFCERSGLSGQQIRRLVSGMPVRQRAAALWRSRLPLYWRLIPSAPL